MASISVSAFFMASEAERVVTFTMGTCSVLRAMGICFSIPSE